MSEPPIRRTGVDRANESQDGSYRDGLPRKKASDRSGRRRNRRHGNRAVSVTQWKHDELTTWCVRAFKRDAILRHVASWGDRIPHIKSTTQCARQCQVQCGTSASSNWTAELIRLHSLRLDQEAHCCSVSLVTILRTSHYSDRALTLDSVSAFSANGIYGDAISP
jgi:hypothetical protein